MLKRIIIFKLILFTVFFTSCWDQRLLKDHKLILGIGYDINKENKIIKTVTFPRAIVGDPQQIEGSEESEIISTIGDTVKDAENKVDQYISGKFDRSKSEIVLMGERLAKDGIFSTLDSLYRDLRGPLNASVAIIEGTAEKALNINKTYNILTSAFYSQLLDSAHDSGLIRRENIQAICPVILTEGEDIILPYLSFNEDNNQIDVKGSALFSGDKMTGILNLKQSTMLLILSNKTPKRTKVNLKVTENKKEYDKNFVDFSIRNMKRKLHITTDNNKVKANINITLKIEIDEYSTDNLEDKKHGENLSKQIEKKLVKTANQTIEKIQKANNDSLKIGQKVRAYHNSTWKEFDWKEVYPDIPIEVNFDVEIIRHGIVN